MGRVIRVISNVFGDRQGVSRAAELAEAGWIMKSTLDPGTRKVAR